MLKSHCAPRCERLRIASRVRQLGEGRRHCQRRHRSMSTVMTPTAGASSIAPFRANRSYTSCTKPPSSSTTSCARISMRRSVSRAALRKACRPPKRMPPRAGAARSSRWPSKRWDISPRCGTSPPRSAARPRFGRMNFPLDTGGLPASVVVRLEPFSEAVLQHFIFLERPMDSNEPDGAGFVADFQFKRGISAPRVTPMPIDYDTVGVFYQTLSREPARLRRARRRERSFLRRPQPADLAQGDRFPGLRAGDLPENRAQGLRRHREPGRRRGARVRRVSLRALRRDPRRTESAEGGEPGVRARVSGGGESGAAPAGARGSARVDRERSRRPRSSTSRTRPTC